MHIRLGQCPKALPEEFREIVAAYRKAVGPVAPPKPVSRELPPSPHAEEAPRPRLPTQPTPRAGMPEVLRDPIGTIGTIGKPKEAVEVEAVGPLHVFLSDDLKAERNETIHQLADYLKRHPTPSTDSKEILSSFADNLRHEPLNREMGKVLGSTGGESCGSEVCDHGHHVDPRIGEDAEEVRIYIPQYETSLVQLQELRKRFPRTTLDGGTAVIDVLLEDLKKQSLQSLKDLAMLELDGKAFLEVPRGSPCSFEGLDAKLPAATRLSLKKLLADRIRDRVSRAEKLDELTLLAFWLDCVAAITEANAKGGVIILTQYGDIEFGDVVRLTCRIGGLGRPKAVWMHLGKGLKSRFLAMREQNPKTATGDFFLMLERRDRERIEKPKRRQQKIMGRETGDALSLQVGDRLICRTSKKPHVRARITEDNLEEAQSLRSCEWHGGLLEVGRLVDDQVQRFSIGADGRLVRLSAAGWVGVGILVVGGAIAAGLLWNRPEFQDLRTRLAATFRVAPAVSAQGPGPVASAVSGQQTRTTFPVQPPEDEGPKPGEFVFRREAKVEGQVQTAVVGFFTDLAEAVRARWRAWLQESGVGDQGPAATVLDSDSALGRVRVRRPEGGFQDFEFR